MAESAAGAVQAPRTRSATRHSRAERTNVNDIERVLSVAAGGALAAYALKKRDVSALLVGLLGGALVERGVTGHCRVYGALGMSTTEGHAHLVQQHGPNAVLDASTAQRVERTVTINRSASELYTFWRDFANLPRIMKHLESVEVLDQTRSRWTAKAPAGQTVTWEAEVYNEVPNELIAWRSLDDADVPNAGSVHFRTLPHDRGTEVRVLLEYRPPAGRLGGLLAKLFHEEPDAQVREDLRRFKQLMEAGELAVSEVPGQGPRAKGTQFNAQANDDPAARAAAPAPGTTHAPRHVPAPADTARGHNTTEHGEVGA
jgi:uncharacterized membrane protein